MMLQETDSRPVFNSSDEKAYGGNRFSDLYSKMYPGMKWINRRVNYSFDKPMFICEYAHAMGNAIGNLRYLGKHRIKHLYHGLDYLGLGKQAVNEI